MSKIIKTRLSLLLLTSLTTLASCGLISNTSNDQPSSTDLSSDTPSSVSKIKKIKETGPLSKFYFEGDEESSTFKIDMSEYLDFNGQNNIEFVPSINNKDATNFSIEGNIVKVTVNDFEGDFDLTIKVNVDSKQECSLTFPLSIKKISKIACIGDSLTQGHSWSSEAYPVYLQDDFISGITIGNYGQNGANITGYGGMGTAYQYTKLGKYTNSKNFQPDVAIIMLGTNDATEWENASKTYESLYRSLISDYLSLNAQVVIVTSPPTIMPNGFNIPNEVIRDSINPIQRRVAKELNLPIVDAREEFENYKDGVRELIRTGDNVHLSVKGAQLMAELVSNKIKTL